MEKAIVLHADILGFKKIIEDAANTDDMSVFEKIRTALNEGIGTTVQFQKLGTNSAIRYKLFSDNLYVSFPYDEGDDQSLSDAYLSCLAFTRSYFAIMLDNKIFIRGGISRGMDFSDDTIIFSLGLVKAYELEQKAIYPRVLIDEELIKFAKDGIITPGPIFLSVLNNSILKDRDGLYFVSPAGLSEELDIEAYGAKGKELNKLFLKQHLNVTTKILKEKIDQKADEGIIKKYQWLQKLLLWLYYDRNSDLSKVRDFSSLRFVKV